MNGLDYYKVFGFPDRVVALDVETTGFSPANGDRVISLGMIEFMRGVPTERRFYSLFNPGVPVGFSESIHGISDADLEDAPKFYEHAHEIGDFVSDSPIVCHNAPFDRRFMTAELALCCADPFPADQYFCTLAFAKGEFKRNTYRLDQLCIEFGIPRPDHDALNDALACGLLYARILKVRNFTF